MHIYQIDFYKNGKLQLLFNTAAQLHLLDRNGNYVERYPVKLRSPATNGMALFDYEKSRDYRIFLAAEDKGVNGFCDVARRAVTRPVNLVIGVIATDELYSGRTELDVIGDLDLGDAFINTCIEISYCGITTVSNGVSTTSCISTKVTRIEEPEF